MIPTGTGLDKKNQEKTKAILNHLTETTFFYRTDAPELYLYLRRNQQAFKDFLHEHFGWRLYVDEHVARIIKERIWNEKVKPSQRALFDLRRRDQCLLFAILLEYHDHERNAQGLTIDEAESLKFHYGDFLTFAQSRARHELGEKAPSMEQLQSAGKELFEQLERHRFVRLVERKRADVNDLEPSGLEVHLLYEMLPGIRCYDATIMHQQAVFARYLDKHEHPGVALQPEANAE